MRCRLLAATLGAMLLAVAAAGCGDDPPAITFDEVDATTLPPATSAPTAATDVPATTVPAATYTTAPFVPSPSGGARTRIEWSGSSAYRLGANLPWFNYGRDFGGGPAGGGVSSAEVTVAVGAALRTAHDAGINTVRWWMFPGDPTQIMTDDEGLPTAIDPQVFVDVDAALALAEEHDMDYVFTLFSGPDDMPPLWRQTVEGRERLAEVLGTLFARYRDDPHVMTWQVVNEPEWDIWGGAVGAQNVQDMVRAIAASVHANSGALVSVGGARLDGIELWTGLGLDYYTVHWYDPMTAPEHCLPCTSYDDLAARAELDAPVVVGEFYLGPDIDALARLQDFDRLGYAGSFAWSLLGDRTSDHLEIDLGAVAAFHPANG